MTAVRLFGDARELASLIDHTLLKPEATETEIEKVCHQAIEYSFASVCVNPCWVSLVHSKLSRSQIRTCSVVGFPLGANTTRIKLQEAQLAIADGAKEIDMVLNVGVLRSSGEVLSEIRQIADAVHESDAILKVILETCLLNDEQKRSACLMAKDGGADFVKTSTGFSSAGAIEADVRLMRAVVGNRVGVKASGGVRTLETLSRMVGAGANRIGTSSGVQIIAEFQSEVVPDSGDGESY